ncbi:unnamed protein product [Linum tenue]|uniref:CNNM transmembrane domain-containing protein n=1 Tax=Linum tenue TaxID=586396 RepID=A0AAV0N5E4_9ROSI|nr:unnamed protein product [Linum tenue]
MAVEYTCCSSEFFIHILIIVMLVLFAGMMSGLTLGLMSLSLVDLEVLAKSGTPQDRKYAAKILPVVKNQHWLLCTLLICNAAAMEALPIFLDSLITAWGAILISVTLILLFGEIIPQAVCTRYGLAIGATVAPFVRVLVWICSPIAYPISKLLDYLLGHGHVALFRRAELKTLVNFHGNEAGKGGELTHDETTIIAGALELSEKTAGDAMTPLAETFAIDINGKLDRVQENLPLYDILNEFQKGHSHMAVVVKVRVDVDGEKPQERSLRSHKSFKKWKSFPNRNDSFRASRSRKWNKEVDSDILEIDGKPLPTLPEEEEAVGIITMEDVIEELLQVVTLLFPCFPFSAQFSDPDNFSFCCHSNRRRFTMKQTIITSSIGSNS